MPYTNGLAWGKPGGVVGTSSGSAPYAITSVKMTQADLDDNSDKLIRIPVHGVYQIAISSLVATDDLALGSSGTTVAKAYYYGMNSVGEIGTPQETRADSVHIMNCMMHSDVGSTSNGDFTAAQTYTDSTGLRFSTCNGQGANSDNGDEASAICSNLQLSQAADTLILPNEVPVDTAGFVFDVIFLGGYFQELVVAFDYGSSTAAARFNVMCNRIYY